MSELDHRRFSEDSGCSTTTTEIPRQTAEVATKVLTLVKELPPVNYLIQKTKRSRPMIAHVDKRATIFQSRDWNLTVNQMIVQVLVETWIQRWSTTNGPGMLIMVRLS